ncbi:hypothetical protein [Maledivibacter halophilus]|uniref:Uncharacterized protein n=1 Tax=Maledivibacter halophilus TaxID=36842 RepID=A0A1T5JWM4_9FIRM|nr:hypothetical protein [Maledivibacter halophilus]SKC55801.1 hypothetical protein SAMN02194393_01406 [Maledivibacter halophilus]
MIQQGQNKDLLEEKLKWVKYRLEILDKIENKLKEIKTLAQYAKNNNLNSTQIKEINSKINILNEEILKLDEESRTFSPDYN